MQKDIKTTVSTVIQEIKNTAMINNSDSPILHVSMTENSIYVNGDGAQWSYKFSQEEIEAVIQELINMGAIPNQDQKNMVTFTDPSLLLPQKNQAIQINPEVINTVIQEIKNTAMINNSDSPVLYVSMTENSIYVNGDGAQWSYKFSQEEIEAVIQELINMGAVPNQEQKNMVTFTDPSLILNNHGRK